MKIKKSEEEWKKILTPEQFKVLRLNGTEIPNKRKLLYNKEKGIYVCSGCGNELFSSEHKFDSRTGWPSFFEVIKKEKIELKKDFSQIFPRTEVVCAKCGGHLGHVFEDGPKEKTGKRYCINSVSLKFKRNKFINKKPQKKS